MENGLAGHLVTDDHAAISDEAKQTGPNCDIPRVNFDDLETDCNCGIQYTAAETVCAGKHNGERDVCCRFICTFM